MKCPECNREGFKGTRGVSLHLHAGCPAVIYRMFVDDDYSVFHLACVFRRSEKKIEEIIRVQAKYEIREVE